MRLRTMTPAELPIVLDWAAAEGWNPGLDDAGAFYAADPEGFFIAELDGAPVAAISVVNHSDGFAFLGLYICRPEFRGRGFGHAVWHHGMAHAGDRTVGLDGVPAQQDSYRRAGFTLMDETARFTGTLPGGSPRKVRDYAPEDFDALSAIDRRAIGYRRPAFLRAWLDGTDTRKTLVADGKEGPEGFVTYRTCREGTKIGPLSAPDIKLAGSLLSAAAKQSAAPHIVDVPGGQTELATLCADAGMQITFRTARMYKGPPPVGGGRIEAVATLELG